MDDKIIACIKQKQEKGISMLLDQYGGLMKSIVRKYIAGRPQEIEECIADITIAIWYHIDDFDSRKNTFKNWVAAIAKFKAIDALITNFHLPKSTLLMLVSALAGKELIMTAYDAAIKNSYRFFSFGDAMFIK